jgi:hypothetical protein
MGLEKTSHGYGLERGAGQQSHLGQGNRDHCRSNPKLPTGTAPINCPGRCISPTSASTRHDLWQHESCLELILFF